MILEVQNMKERSKKKLVNYRIIRISEKKNVTQISFTRVISPSMLQN